MTRRFYDAATVEEGSDERRRETETSLNITVTPRLTVRHLAEFPRLPERRGCQQRLGIQEKSL